MISLRELPNTLTISQKYFIERALELVNSKTVDTYRARLHNHEQYFKSYTKY